MTRRELLQGAAIAAGAAAVSNAADTTLPGTQPLDWEGDLSVRMMDGAHRFVERKIAESLRKRGKANRERLAKIIGLVDARVPVVMERFADNGDSDVVAETESYRAHQVRWPVLDGVHGEGLLLQPAGTPIAWVIAIPDADQLPEQFETAWRLAASGFAVIVPTLVDRTSRWSGHADIKVTDQTHREWIYRQAFHMGRHVIGYEVQKVLGAIDWVQRVHAGAKIGVAGYGEGGLIAFYASAVDTRIDAAMVSGYFDDRQAVWSEPIYRNVWGLLREFGDAEIATLIAPRGLVVEYTKAPEVVNQKGEIHTPPFERVAAEFARIDSFAPREKRQLVRGDGLNAFAQMLGGTARRAAAIPADRRRAFSADERQRRTVLELEGHVQRLIRASERLREDSFLYKVAPELADDRWTTDLRRPGFPLAKFVDGAKPYREYFRDEVLGKFDDPLLPPNARTRRIYDREKWTGYEVVLDVWPDVFAWGVLLVPKDIRAGERRPVVVCQHGRQGVPQETIEGNTAYYHDFAARLAERGFVTFAPHNLYRGEDRYRWLSRKANGVKASMFSFIVSQHEQLLRWLGSLPFVDPARIGFYGLSYGGETAVRVPALLEGYALSICSGDFNSWTEKVAATDLKFGFMYTIEWEMPYFDMGNTFDYAEMTYLIAPRPFMVERGHNDRVSRDQWVAREYAKTRWLYAQLGIEERTQIEYFNGGHTINGEGTFAFLDRWLMRANH